VFSRSALLAFLSFLAVMLVRVMLALLAVVLVRVMLALLAVVLVMILALLAILLVIVRRFGACAPASLASRGIFPIRKLLPRLAMTFGCCADLALAPASVAAPRRYAPHELLGHWARFALGCLTRLTSAFAGFASIPVLALLKLLSELTPASGCFAYCSCARESVASPCIQSFFEPLGFGT